MLSDSLRAYIAGFLDGDGCIMMQLVRRKDYVFGYQVRASIVFYQKTKHRPHLEWLKRKLKYGYVRDRNDGMSEYTIVGIRQVREILVLLEPYVRLKRKQIALAHRICEKIPKRVTPKSLIAIGKLVDRYAELNYSKKRTNTSEVLQCFIDKRVTFPRND